VAWGDVAANGSNNIVHTPNLDAMAAAGLRLTRCYATSPQCTPTRAGFLTGKHPSRHACYCAGGNPLPTEATTMAELLRDHGYATGHFGKWHLGGVSLKDTFGPLAQGFQQQYSIINSYQVHKMDVSFTRTEKPHNVKSEGYCEDAVMTAALEFIRASHQENKPFLAVIWNLAPHTPFFATGADRQLYSDLPEEAQHYWGQISNIDKNVGRLRSTLRDLGIAEETMLVFTSDNGAVKFSRDHDPFQGGKNNLWEGGLRVPGLIEWPARISQPVVSDIPVNLVDLFPTVLEAAGVEVPNDLGELDGISLLPLFDGQWQKRPAPMGFHFLHQRWEGNLERKREQFLSEVGKVGFAVVDNNYKLITNLKGESAQLYDVVDDPGEVRDLAPEHPEVVARLQVWRQRWWASVVDDQKQLGISIDPENLQPLPQAR
jgi:arylsulfatase A-like enzyme